MKHAIVITAACLAGLFSAVANAVVPESGFWWNPQQAGRGWTLEHQNGTLAVAHYLYDDARNPIFFTSAGTLDADTGIADVAVLRNVGGQCYGCTPSAPSSSSIATMRLTFTSPTRGTLAINGETIAIERFSFGYGAALPEQMRGTWVETTVGPTQSFGDSLTITGPCASCTSIPQAFQGHRTQSAARVLVGGAVGTTGLVLILLDTSASYYTEYVLEPALDQWVGGSVTYLKGTTNPPSPITAGLDFWARRVTPKEGAVFKASSEIAGDVAAADRAAALADAGFSAKTRAAQPEIDATRRALLRALAPNR